MTSHGDSTKMAACSGDVMKMESSKNLTESDNINSTSKLTGTSSSIPQVGLLKARAAYLILSLQ